MNPESFRRPHHSRHSPLGVWDRQASCIHHRRIHTRALDRQSRIAYRTHQERAHSWRNSNCNYRHRNMRRTRLPQRTWQVHRDKPTFRHSSTDNLAPDLHLRRCIHTRQRRHRYTYYRSIVQVHHPARIGPGIQFASSHKSRLLRVHNRRYLHLFHRNKLDRVHRVLVHTPRARRV